MLRTLVKPIARKEDDPLLPPVQQALARLFRYLGPYRWRMFFTLMIYVICVTITQLYPYIDRILIDKHIAVGNTDGFLPLLTLAVVAHLLNWGGVWLRTLLIQRISLSILVDLGGNNHTILR